METYFWEKNWNPIKIFENMYSTPINSQLIPLFTNDAVW